MVKHSDECTPFTFAYIRALTDPRVQAQYLAQQYFQVLDKIPTEDRSYYQTLFQQKLHDSQLSNEDRQLFKRALSAIKKRYQ